MKDGDDGLRPFKNLFIFRVKSVVAFPSKRRGNGPKTNFGIYTSQMEYDNVYYKRLFSRNSVV